MSDEIQWINSGGWCNSSLLSAVFDLMYIQRDTLWCAFNDIELTRYLSAIIQRFDRNPVYLRISITKQIKRPQLVLFVHARLTDSSLRRRLPIRGWDSWNWLFSFTSMLLFKINGSYSIWLSVQILPNLRKCLDNRNYIFNMFSMCSTNHSYTMWRLNHNFSELLNSHAHVSSGLRRHNHCS